MPQSVIILSDDPSLFSHVAAVLRSDSRFHVVGDDLMHCDGSAAPLTNIYPIETSAAEWEDWRPTENGPQNPGQMSSPVLETRVPAWVAEVGLLLARGLETPAWFVDAREVAWPVGGVDPHQIALA